MNLDFLFTAVSSSLSPERDATQRSIKLNPITPKPSVETDGVSGLSGTFYSFSANGDRFTSPYSI